MRIAGMSTIELTNSSVVVLGGTGALGQRIARRLAEDGARVTVAGRDRAKANEIAASIGGVGATVDFLDSSTLHTPFSTAYESFGSVDGIINAAGVVAFGPLAGTTAEVIDEVMTTNLTGPLALYADAIPRMSYGFIANLTGVVAVMPTAGMAAYSASKAGLSAATIALARELRRDGITVIDIRPPHTETGLVGRALVGEPPRLPEGLDPDLVAARTVAGIAEGRRVLEADWFSSAGS
jgi:NAD(P)-dependent dehydrogenase (short-subunit alcohol dehydrogenase family)